MHLSTYHRKESQKHEKKDQILPLHKSLASFFTKKTYLRPSYSSHYSESPMRLLPTELIQTLTVTHLLTHRMQKAFHPQVG